MKIETIIDKLEALKDGLGNSTEEAGTVEIGLEKLIGDLKKEKAAQYLKTLDQQTVIDWNWNEYLDPTTREALNTLCEAETYSDVCDKYEGYTLAELINELSNQ